MNEWQIVLLTGGVTIVTSVITALITLSITHRNEVKKLVLEKRAELYFEFYNEVEHLLHDRSKIYDSNYIGVLLEFKPKMKLLASARTVEAFKSFYELVTKHYDEYRRFCNNNDPRNNPDFLEKGFDEDGVEYEICHATDLEISYFESDAEKFKDENVPSYEIVSQHITSLYTAMRNDLGSNLK